MYKDEELNKMIQDLSRRMSLSSNNGVEVLSNQDEILLNQQHVIERLKALKEISIDLWNYSINKALENDPQLFRLIFNLSLNEQALNADLMSTADVTQQMIFLDEHEAKIRSIQVAFAERESYEKKDLALIKGIDESIRKSVAEFKSEIREIWHGPLRGSLKDSAFFDVLFNLHSIEIGFERDVASVKNADEINNMIEATRRDTNKIIQQIKIIRDNKKKADKDNKKGEGSK